MEKGSVDWERQVFMDEYLLRSARHGQAIMGKIPNTAEFNAAVINEALN